MQPNRIQAARVQPGPWRFLPGAHGALQRLLCRLARAEEMLWMAATVSPPLCLVETDARCK